MCSPGTTVSIQHLLDVFGLLALIMLRLVDLSDMPNPDLTG